jgi:hypothetical protein
MTLDDKVRAILVELAPDRISRLEDYRDDSPSQKKLARALRTEHADSIARDIAFHLDDWKKDAAFLLAVHLFPERFTAKEIRSGVSGFLIHAPNHIAAAAKLAGWPIKDIFKVGPLVEECD